MDLVKKYKRELLETCYFISLINAMIDYKSWKANENLSISGETGYPIFEAAI